MQCPSCAAEVAEESRFCNSCGTALPLHCRACGHSNPAGSRFCSSCGTRLDGGQAPAPGERPAQPRPAPPAAVAERRPVTVMFSDLVGSTALSTQLDAEDLREVLAAYHSEIAATVRRFGGFVAQFMGDGVMVYFGYPEAHEDDAERAVLAGLESIAAIKRLPSPIGLQTRIGIATGLVVTGDLAGSAEAQPGRVVGETPNLAARLQTIAEPDTVVIAEGTRKLLGNLFELDDLGARDLKGIGPVRAWSVLRPSSAEGRFEALHSGSLTALVGREEEFELLRRRWAKAKAGDGQVVLLSGEAGIGKSRLTAALADSIAGEPHTRLRYFCSSQHSASALYPIIRQIERAAGLERDDTPTTKLDKLHAMLAQTSTPAEHAALIAEMMGLANDGRYPALPLAPQRRRQKTLEALGLQMEALARRGPVLMTFEDAHWIDPTSLELIGRAVERIRDLRVLLIVTFRPDFEAPWTGAPHVTSLSINRLARREVEAIIDRVSGSATIAAPIKREIIDRSDGIPLFVQEMTKAVLEAEHNDAAHRTTATVPSLAVAVPAILHASLTARLDRLGPAKEIMQTGAAIGREVFHAVLAAVTHKPDAELNAALDRLIEADLFLRHGVPPHATYLFKHALMQDAAYGTLLRGNREALHAQIAQVYEQQFPDLVEARPELLADHLARAGSAERAIAFYLKAARAATANGAVVEAAAQLRRGLALVAKLSGADVRQRLEIELQIALGNALMASSGFSSVQTDAAFARAGELCRAAGDNAQFVRVLWGQFTGHFAGGRQHAALAVARELLALAQSLGDAAAEQMGHASIGACLSHMGAVAEAGAPFERALAADKGREQERSFRYGLSGRVVAMAYESFNLLLLGFPDRARQLAEQSVEEAQASSHPPSLCLAHSIAGRVCYLRGDDAGLAAHAAMVVRLADEQGLALWQALGSIYSGWSRGESGDVDQAVEMIRTGIANYRSVGAGLCLPLYQLSLASVEARLGHAHEALRLLEAAQAAIEAGGERFILAEVYRLIGDIALQAPEPDMVGADAHFQRALAIAREQQARFWELRATVSLARLRRDRGKRHEARELLAPIYDACTEGFDTPDLKAAKDLLGTL